LKKVIIIGGGLSGLICGSILQKNGHDVTVLEHDAQPGGCLQSFRRGDRYFDVGLHYVGGLEPGQSLYPIFHYLGLTDLPWRKMDADCADEVVIGGEHYPLPQGHEAFFNALAERFPHEKEGLRTYVDTLREIGEHIYDIFYDETVAEQRMADGGLFATSAKEWLEQTIHDPLLRNILSGASLKMEQDDNLPLYVFAQINNSFIQSAYRLEGGGQQLISRLCDNLTAMGGTIRTRCTVTQINETDGQATGVTLDSGEQLAADIVISSAHPQQTLKMMEGSSAVRKYYRQRITGLKNAFGMYTCNIRLRPGMIDYINHNIHIHREGADLWHVNTDRVNHILIHSYPDQDALDILTPMRWEQVAPWADKPQGHRGEDYVRMKEAVCQQCIDLACQAIPNLREAIEHIYTSTPLTYQSYLLAPEGTAYGVQKDWHSPITTFLTPKTPIRGLYMTGQSLNLHGILGTAMTALQTCKAAESREGLIEN